MIFMPPGKDSDENEDYDDLMTANALNNSRQVPMSTQGSNKMKYLQDKQKELYYKKKMSAADQSLEKSRESSEIGSHIDSDADMFRVAQEALGNTCDQDLIKLANSNNNIVGSSPNFNPTIHQ